MTEKEALPRDGVRGKRGAEGGRLREEEQSYWQVQYLEEMNHSFGIKPTFNYPLSSRC